MEEELVDLADRWRRARAAALRPLAPEGTAESALPAAAMAASAAEAERRVFDNSLRLGRGFARVMRRELSLDEIPGAFARLGVPCLAGQWRRAEGEAALFLERRGCESCTPDASPCDVWREAISGLLLGVSGGLQLARHESRGHGNPRCVDVIHEDPESPLRFGPIPTEAREALTRVRRTARAFDSTADVELLGVSEGTLFYRVTRSGRAGDLSLRTLVERGVRRHLPDLACREVSPRPVLSGAP